MDKINEFFNKLAALADEGKSLFKSELEAAIAAIPASEKIFTQLEMDVVKAEAEAKIASLEAKVTALESTDAIKLAVEAAVDQRTIEMVEDFESTLVDNGAFLAKYKKVKA